MARLLSRSSLDPATISLAIASVGGCSRPLSGESGQKLLLCSLNLASTSSPVTMQSVPSAAPPGRFWGNGHRCTAVLIGSGPNITKAIGVLGHPSSPSLGRRTMTYCSAHWIDAGSGRIYESNRIRRRILQSVSAETDRLVLLCSLDPAGGGQLLQSRPSAAAPVRPSAAGHRGEKHRGFWPFGQKQRQPTTFKRHRSSPIRPNLLRMVKPTQKPVYSTGFCSGVTIPLRLALWLPSLTVASRCPTGHPHED